MITFEEAYEIIMMSAKSLPTESVPLENAVGRVLAENAVSDMDMPPFDKAAMDGYACREKDIASLLRLSEEIPAGMVPKHVLKAGECSKIMTGAMVPEGADCVIMVEYTEQTSENTIRFTGEKTESNICLAGEDVETGDIVVKKGTLLEPRHIAALAAVGYAEPLVSKRPRVGVLPTGSELVAPSEKASGAKIRNSNGP
ncbi:MAG: molybdopterin molybdotransferase MoeA, partial [Victivallales bacterium]|nr:molybdopterin molybdotransferase MoeA [Victivallales bacterium]